MCTGQMIGHSLFYNSEDILRLMTEIYVVVVNLGISVLLR